MLLDSTRIRSHRSSSARCLQPLRVGRRAAVEQSGFSLLELLVVTLIIGILAAIIVPSFLGQTGKAVDAQAKMLARMGQTTAETIASEHEGAYDNVSAGELNRLEPSLRTTASSSDAFLSSASGKQGEYTLTAKASNGDEFKVSRAASGEIARECVSPLTKTGCSGGERASW